MSDPRINGLRSIELGVHDLQKSAEFYRKVWALEDVAAEGDTIHLRGTGRDHHVRDAARAAAGRRCSACISRLPTAPPSMRCTPRPRRWAPRSAGAAARCQASAGGGYGFRVSTPEGHPICDLVRRRRSMPTAIDDRTRPTKLTHVVLNSAEVREADRVLPRRARLQVERLDLHDGFRALLLRPSQRRVRARQRAVAQPHGL